MAHMVSQRGGASIGYGYILSWNGRPFARLDATESGITLKFLWKQYHFDKDSVSAIREYKGLFSRGVQILHTKNDYPPFIVFWTFDPIHWTFNPKKLISQLKQLGFAVQEGERSPPHTSRVPMDGALTQEENEAQVKRHLWPARLAQTGFMVSILFYGIILGVLGVLFSGTQMYDTDDFLGSDPVATVIGGVLAVVGIAGIALGYFLPRLIARQYRKRVGALLLRHIFRCQLFLVTAIVGLVLGVMGAGWAFSTPFLVVAFAALALTFPTKRKWLKMLE